MIPDEVYTALGVVLVAALALVGQSIARRYGRVAAMEKRIAAMEANERESWLYIRALIDHIYRGRGLPLPPAPPSLFGGNTHENAQ